MPVGDGCQDTGASISWSSTIPSSVALSDVHVLNRAPTSPSIRGACEYNGGGTLQAGYRQEIWLVSGPGPTYTNEVLLGHLDGVVPAGSVNGSTWNLSQLLPVAGRTWDWTRDGFRSTNNAAFTATSASPLTLFYIGCSAAAVTDCCSETLAKLDQIIGYVSRAFQPLA